MVEQLSSGRAPFFALFMSITDSPVATTLHKANKKDIAGSVL